MCTTSAIHQQDPILGMASVDKGRALDVLGAVRDLCLKGFFYCFYKYLLFWVVLVDGSLGGGDLQTAVFVDSTVQHCELLFAAWWWWCKYWKGSLLFSQSLPVLFSFLADFCHSENKMKRGGITDNNQKGEKKGEGGIVPSMYRRRVWLLMVAAFLFSGCRGAVFSSTGGAVHWSWNQGTHLTLSLYSARS